MRGDEHWDLPAQHELEQRDLDREEETLRHTPADVCLHTTVVCKQTKRAGYSSAKAAKEVGVSERRVRQAKQVKDGRPDLAPAVHPTFAQLLDDWRRAVVDLARSPEEDPQ